MSTENRPVLAVTGAGGIGVAIARACGVGRTVVLGDVDEDRLAAVRSELADEGLEVVTCRTDVSSAPSVAGLARTAAGAGPLLALAHTAGVSPLHATPAAILAVDLLGTALVLDAFLPAMAPGGAAVAVASMAGHLAGSLGDADEALLATAPAADLVTLELCRSAAVQDDPAWAYLVAKRGNLLRVRAAAAAWGGRGLRLNTISPGVIATEMGQQELDGSNGGAMRQLVADSALGRVGTAEDIAGVAAFLLGQQAAYVTGTDVLVDGGVLASL